MNSPSSAQIQKAAIALLTSPKPELRKRALYILEKSQNEKVLRAILYASQNDSDAEVRQRATEILNTLPADALNEAGISWTCPHCDTLNVGGKNCQLCGSPRIDAVQFAMLTPTEILNHLPGGQVVNQVANIFAGCQRLFLIPFILAGVLLIVMAVKSWLDWRSLSDSGITTFAEIIDRRTSTDDEGKMTYFVTYRFYHNEVAYSREESVSRSLFDTSATGEPVSIVYLPDNPNVSNLGTSPTSPLPLTIMALLWNLLVGIFWFRPQLRGGMSIRMG